MVAREGAGSIPRQDPAGSDGFTENTPHPGQCKAGWHCSGVRTAVTRRPWLACLAPSTMGMRHSGSAACVLSSISTCGPVGSEAPSHASRRGGPRQPRAPWRAQCGAVQGGNGVLLSSWQRQLAGSDSGRPQREPWVSHAGSGSWTAGGRPRPHMWSTPAHVGGAACTCVSGRRLWSPSAVPSTLAPAWFLTSLTGLTLTPRLC